MPGGFVTQCPACSAKLKLKEKPSQGKKLRCPKCSEVFAPASSVASGKTKAKPKQEIDEFGPLDDSSSPSLDPFEEPMQGRRLPGRVRASRGGAAKAPPRREVDDDDDSADEDAPQAKSQKKDGPGSTKAVLIIVGVLAFSVLLCMGTFGYFVFRGAKFMSKLAGMQAASGAGIPTKYLPNAPEVVVCVRVADLFTSPSVKAAAEDEEIKKPVELFGKTIGLQPKDIDSVILAIAASPQLRGPKAAAGLSQLRGVSGEGTGSQSRVVVIVRSKKPFNKKAFGEMFKVAKMDNESAVKTQFSGLRVFRAMESSMVAFPEPNVMLLGSVLTVDEILANPSPPVPELAEVDPKQHVIVAVMPTYWPKEENLISPIRDDGPTGSLIRHVGQRLYARDLKLSSVGLTFGKDTRVHMTCICDSEKAAQAKKKSIADDIAAGRRTGLDEDEAMANVGKGKPAGRPKTHFNPLSDPGLYDFSEAASDKTNSLKWSEEAGGETLDFTAVLKGEGPKAQIPQILSRLTFYQPEKEGR